MAPIAVAVAGSTTAGLPAANTAGAEAAGTPNAINCAVVVIVPLSKPVAIAVAPGSVIYYL